jgi:hypothetical protein
MDRHGVQSSDDQVNVFVGALTGAAREWFGSLPLNEVDRTDPSEVVDAIRGRYAKTKMQKIRAFEALR